MKKLNLRNLNNKLAVAGAAVFTAVMVAPSMARADAVSDAITNFDTTNIVSAGAALERVLAWFDRLTLKAGWIGSFDRERSGENRWLTPGGFSVDVTVQKKKVGIRNMFYHGDPLWSLWSKYGSSVYKGDPFFVVSGVNNYTMVYWHPQLWRGVTLRLELGMHTDGRNVGLQQVAWVGMSLDGDFFKRK